MTPEEIELIFSELPDSLLPEKLVEFRKRMVETVFKQMLNVDPEHINSFTEIYYQE